MKVQIDDRYVKVNIPVSDATADLLKTLSDAGKLTQERFDKIIEPDLPKPAKDMPKLAYRISLAELAKTPVNGLAILTADGYAQVRTDLDVDRHIVIAKECLPSNVAEEVYTEITEEQFNDSNA